MALNNLMIHTVNIQRPIASKGTSGAEQVTYSNVYTNQPCLVAPMTNAWKILYAQRKIEGTHTVSFNQALTIRTGYQLVFGSRIFRVVGTQNLAERGLVMQVQVQELT